MLRTVNVEQKIAALENMLEKVRTNAAKPRPARGSAIGTSQPITAASRTTDDVAGPAVPVRVAPPTAVAPGTTKFADDDWSDTTETFDTPVALAPPIPGPAKDAGKAAATATPKPGPAKPAPTTAAATPKPGEVAAAKPAPALVTPAAKPAQVAPVAKPSPVTPVAKPATPAPITKPTTPANAPIPLTNKVAPPVIKTPAIPNVAAKPIETNVNRTLTGVGDGAIKAPDIRAGAIAAGISLPNSSESPLLEPVIELEKKAPPTKSDVSAKPSLPSAFADVEGEEENEPTQLYEPSAASRRAAELAALSEKQLDDAKKSLGLDKKGESDKVDIRLPDAKASSEKIDIKETPKLDLPWVERTERKIDPATLGLSPADDKNVKKGPSQTELDLELIASQGELENVELDVADAKGDAKAPAPVAADKPAVKDEPAPISEKKPVVAAKPVDEPKLPVVADLDIQKPLVKAPVVQKAPVVEQAPPSEDALLVKPSQPSRGVPTLLIVAAVILILVAGAFVAMQQGWIGGAQPTAKPTVAPPTNPTPTATQTAAPTSTATQTAATDTTAPAASASAAPADSASAAPADSASAAPADSAGAAPADSAAAPPASASAAAPPATAPAAVAGTPSIDPATLNNNQGLIFVTSNKPARVYLTGKLAGDTNAELKTDCGLKFVRLADPNQDITKPPMWLTPGAPQQIDCRKYTTFTINVP